MLTLLLAVSTILISVPASANDVPDNLESLIQKFNLANGLGPDDSELF